MKIIVWKDKHATYYYDASTFEAWDASAIEILGALTGEYGYMYEPEEPHVSAEAREKANINLDELPENARKLIEDDVRKARAYIERQQREYEFDTAQRNLALKYVADGKSPKMTRGKDSRYAYDLPAAWLIIENRNGGEYEDFDIETVWTKESK